MRPTVVSPASARAAAPSTSFLFSLRQLQYAVAVADELSFRKAAQRCGVSQPALSAQISELERVWGVRLFERDKRRVLVARAADELIARARALLLDAADLTGRARRAADPWAGTLRIGVIPTVGPYLVPHLTRPFKTRFPRLTIAWIEDKTDTLVARLADGTIDAALLALEAQLGDVVTSMIATDPFVLAAPPGHPLARGRARAAPRELNDTDVLLLDDGHCFREQALAFCSRARAHELEFRATSLGTLVQMVAAGAGVTLLPELAVATEARRTRLRMRSFTAPGPHRTIALAWRKQSALASVLPAIADVVREAYPRAANP